MPLDTPEAALNLARDFMASRILLAGAELNIFSLLKQRPLSAPAIAKAVNADLRALTILLDALAALGLLVKQEELYHCVPQLSAILTDDHPDSILPMLLHLAHLWRRWSSLTDIVRGTQQPGKITNLTLDDKARAAFIGAMHAIGFPRAQATVSAIQPGTAQRLLDVGGASGTYTIAFLQASPAMQATLFDQPEVIAMARERLDQAGLVNRVQLVAGDFYRDELPQGHDLAFVSAIIHQNSPAQNLELYGKIFRALQPGGRIVIRDHVMEPNGTAPPGGAIFAVNMLVATESGGTYTMEEITDGLLQAGFQKVRLLRKAEMDSLVEAFKPQDAL
ncbi:MAG: methyltransferase [Syntrophales bacterium]